ncbi:lipoyl(octanoyl) transferase [Sanguibacter gelidistatuariae]|uniref:Octanoyltransferase n=1 Tax=Sanguibacter gelidistatuariae TaxID=1814289 RepID=A0A1G6R7C2_9MICO|nr:lipoyl(octanoyl) transferase LipB [Sanguibacter gelidistatuariae]SDD00540.1 lipoyl(octanoyl) transferase [Sanguibacter gelidistatuariae]
MEFQAVDLGTTFADYEQTWALQREIHEQVRAGTRPDTVLLVEHASVYTAGRRTHVAERPTDGLPVIDVDRGGKITWHGPGQLVAYPIITLPDPIDVVTYVRALEAAVIDLCADLGLTTVRVEGRSGVWFPATARRRERKVCAIGVRVARGVTMHGLALNCDPDLSHYATIVPCGISDADVTTLASELDRPFTITDAEPMLRKHLAHALSTLSSTSRSPTGQNGRSTTLLA